MSALTAYREAFGLVLVEALACGTPVVGADHGAVPEVVDREGIGALFEDGDERGVARALLEGFELAADAGTAARCRDGRRTSPARRLAAEYEALYLELLDRG